MCNKDNTNNNEGWQKCSIFQKRYETFSPAKPVVKIDGKWEGKQIYCKHTDRYIRLAYKDDAGNFVVVSNIFSTI